MNSVVSLWISSIFFISLYKQCLSDSFQLIGPSAPIIATTGQDIILPCHLKPETRPPDMVLVWMKIGSKSNEHILAHDGNRNETKIKPNYENRVELFNEELDQGNVSLKLKNTMISDQGNYTCDIMSVGELVRIELQIADIGETPFLYMDGYVSGGIKVLCKSKNWFPQPSLQWIDTHGQILTVKYSTEEESNPNGSFNVQSDIILKHGDPNPVTCVVRNPLLRKELGSSMEIAESFFPAVSAWVVLFWLLLVAYAAAIVTFVYKFQAIKTKTEKADREKKNASQEHERLLQERDAGKKETEKEMKRLQDEINQCRKEIDWRKCRNKAVKITLQQVRAHNELSVNEVENSVGYRIKTEPAAGNQTSSEELAIAIAAEGYKKGKYYWEVDTGKRKQWVLGVVSESEATKNYCLQPNQDGSLIGIQMKNDKLSALHSRDTLRFTGKCTTIGIYLDCDNGSVSFYCADDYSKIDTFKHKISGDIYPFLSPGPYDGDEQPLKICSIISRN